MMMRILKWLVRLAAGLGLLILIGGYLGAVHPMGDSLAVFRMWAAGAVLVAALILALLRDRAFAALAGTAAVVSAGPVLGAMSVSASEVTRVDATVYVKNLGNRRADVVGLIEDIRASGADILLLQEMTVGSALALRARMSEYPHWHTCEFSGWSGMAVVSRWPLSATACTGHRSVAAAQVEAPGGPIWAASIHQLWPFPHEQALLLPEVLDVLNVTADRQIVAGDFNMVPWAHSVREIQRVSGTTRISPVQTTILLRGIGLPIDHVLTTGQGRVERRPQLGSDHFGLVARIGFAR